MSPANGAGTKRKMYSTTDANPIGQIGPMRLDFTLPEPAAKRQRVGKSTRVRFDGVAVPDKAASTTRATRMSTRATKASSKKELFGRLARELRAVVKTVEEIAEASD
jgi:hypothetical protein